jgi:hypothetical protein
MKYLTIACSLLLFASCRTKDKIVPGKGGSAAVTAYPQHHLVAKNIINGKVYIRYNTLDAPADGIYSDSINCVNHDSLLSGTFTGLQNGNYYFYATGYDTSISQKVKGGTPYTITSQAAQNLPIGYISRCPMRTLVITHCR